MLLIMGSGSVGSLIGGQLAANGFEVILVGHGAHIDKIQKNGLRIKGLVNHKVDVIAEKSIASLEKKIDGKNISLVIFTTKAHQTKRAALELMSFITKDTVLLSIQNGIGTEREIREVFKQNIILRGVTSIGVCRPKPGIVDFTGAGTTLIGYQNKYGLDHAETIVGMMKNCGITAELDHNIMGSVFTKTIVNCALNPLTAIHKVKNKEIYNNLKLREQARIIAKEAWDVTKIYGIKLTVKDPINYTFKVIKRTGENTNSMLTDILNKRKTEIDFLNGQIIKLGEKFSADVTHNKEVYEKIKEISKDFT